MRNRGWLLVIAMLIMTSIVFAACGERPTPRGQEPAADEEAADEEAADEEAADEEAADEEGDGEEATDEEAADEEGDGEASGGSATDLEIANDGENLLYNTTELGPVPTGEEITLTFTNDSVVNEHNWILLTTSDDAEAEAFDVAGEEAGAENDYLPQESEYTDMIYARTKLLATGGDEDTITFEAPAPGEYVYLCTVPGHYAAGMHGVLTVDE
jgi:azurin